MHENVRSEVSEFLSVMLCLPKTSAEPTWLVLIGIFATLVIGCHPPRLLLASCSAIQAPVATPGSPETQS